MAFLAKTGLIFSLIVSSIVGFFHHSQAPQLPISATASSKIQASQDSMSESQPLWLPAAEAISQNGGYANYQIKNGSIDYLYTNIHIENPDLPTFEISTIDWGYAKDKNHVYFINAGILPEADPSTFVVLPYHSNNSIFSAIYTKDATRVYYEGSLILGADAATFSAKTDQQCNSYCSYDAQDKNHKYLRGQVIQDNPQTSASTTVLDAQGNQTSFQKDNNFVYFEGSVIPQADAKTFVFVGYETNKDIIIGTYYKDTNQVYFISVQGNFPIVVAGADAPTFVTLNTISPLACGTNCSYTAQDKNHKYQNGQIVQ